MNSIRGEANVTDDARLSQVREETARLLGARAEELDYIDDEPMEIEEQARELPPASDEELPEIEAAAATARALVVPNRISYGVYLQQAGFNGNAVLWKWLGPDCARTNWYYLWSTSINRFERAGWCRRPQTDAYDIRYKIYWRA
jgi:hypothetical protein